jgi:hypothetical protein
MSDEEALFTQNLKQIRYSLHQSRRSTRKTNLSAYKKYNIGPANIDNLDSDSDISK